MMDVPLVITILAVVATLAVTLKSLLEVMRSRRALRELQRERDEALRQIREAAAEFGSQSAEVLLDAAAKRERMLEAQRDYEQLDQSVRSTIERARKGATS